MAGGLRPTGWGPLPPSGFHRARNSTSNPKATAVMTSSDSRRCHGGGELRSPPTRSPFSPDHSSIGQHQQNLIDNAQFFRLVGNFCLPPNRHSYYSLQRVSPLPVGLVSMGPWLPGQGPGCCRSGNFHLRVRYCLVQLIPGLFTATLALKTFIGGDSSILHRNNVIGVIAVCSVSPTF